MTDFKKRIEKLEAGIRTTSCTVTDEAGQPFRLRRDDVLPLTCAAFRRRWAAIEGEPIPVSPFDERLDYLARVGARSTSEPLIEIAADCLRRIPEDGNNAEL